MDGEMGLDSVGDLLHYVNEFVFDKGMRIK
jgi:hypothetical protein